jgi:hypothetical protein
MITRHRRPPEDVSREPTSAKRFLEGETLSLDEFWDAMADEVEAMSHEELRAELAPLRRRYARELH